jgi:orotate phosphoribosyltransferase
MDDAKRDLAKILVENSYLRGDFVLSSGRRSNFYFDCKQTTHFAQAMPLIGRVFIDAFRASGRVPRAVGGLTTGADPISLAIAQSSLAMQGISPINSFIVRKDRKEHGTMKWVDGRVLPGDPVAIVDDVVTSGGSVVRAVQRCREERLEIVYVAVLVDREEGGMKCIETEVPGVPVSAIFTKSELEGIFERNQGTS